MSRMKARAALGLALLAPRWCSAFTPPRSLRGTTGGRHALTRPSHQHVAPPAARRHRTAAATGTSLQSKDDGECDAADEDEECWRAFRAGLVRDGLQSAGHDDGLLLPSEGKTRTPAAGARRTAVRSPARYAHATTPLVEVGSILLSVPTRDLCQALDQQYWHRSVVLVTDVADDPVRGEEEDAVPDEQLAQGAGRGRWSYRGLMLNRLAGARFAAAEDEWSSGDENGDVTSAAAKDGSWPVFRGGDLLGLDSSDTTLVCLHTLPSTTGNGRVRDLSRRIVGPLSSIDLDDALSLVSDGVCDADDFMLLAGYCAWRPGQLEREMGGERGEWIAASVDGSTVWDSIAELRCSSDETLSDTQQNSREEGRGIHDRSASDRLLDAGTGMWTSLLSKLDVDESDAVSRLPPRQLGFYDEMLRTWYREKFRADAGYDDDERRPLPDSSGLIRPGAVVRSTSPPPDDVLLYDAEFAQCVVLVLEESDTATVGVLLNHAMAASLDVVDGAEPSPLRYGGPVDLPGYRDGSWRDSNDDDGDDEEMYEGFLEYTGNDAVADSPSFDYGPDDGDDDDGEVDDSAFLWIARDSSLPRSVRRTPLGSSGLSSMREDDAVDAVQSGLLSPHDVAVYSGVCIWEKSGGMGRVGGGLREQIDALGAMEVVRPAGGEGGDSPALAAFGPVLRQAVLTAETLEGNAVLSDEAWRGGRPDRGPDRKDDDDGGRLAGTVSRAWTARELLQDPFFGLEFN